MRQSGASGTITSKGYSDAEKNGIVNLNSDGTATKAENGESTNESISWKIWIFDKDTKVAGAGLSINAGAGLFYQGLQFSAGFFGPPGRLGQGFVSIGAPKNPLFFDTSISSQVLVGSSTTDKLDLSGNGRAYGAGVGPISGSFSQGLNKQGQVTSNIYGLGPSIGAKYTGGGSTTRTFAFPMLIPKLWTAVGGRF